MTNALPPRDVRTGAGRNRLGRPRRRLGILAATSLLAAGGATGCTIDVGDDEAAAGCENGGLLNSPSLVLVAQAVPSASLLPCIHSIPRGWKEKLSVVNGRAEYTFTSDRENDRAFRVLLTETCDLRGASRVPSEATGTRRYELPTRVTGGYAGRRFYVLPGGCITYRFDLHDSTRAQAVAEATSMVGFVTRNAVREMVTRHSNGRLQLDIPPDGRS